MLDITKRFGIIWSTLRLCAESHLEKIQRIWGLGPLYSRIKLSHGIDTTR